MTNHDCAGCHVNELSTILAACGHTGTSCTVQHCCRCQASPATRCQHPASGPSTPTQTTLYHHVPPSSGDSPGYPHPAVAPAPQRPPAAPLAPHSALQDPHVPPSASPPAPQVATAVAVGLQPPAATLSLDEQGLRRPDWSGWRCAGKSGYSARILAENPNFPAPCQPDQFDTILRVRGGHPGLA